VVDNDHAVRLLGATTRWESLRELTPWGDELLATATTLGLTLATTVGVVDGVHRHTADMRATTEPTAATGLTERLLVMITVADFTDRGSAHGIHNAELSRGHLELGHAVFNGNQL
jgi:hypothetical protein